MASYSRLPGSRPSRRARGLGKKALILPPRTADRRPKPPPLFHEAYTRRNRVWLREGCGSYENKCNFTEILKKIAADFAGEPSI